MINFCKAVSNLQPIR